MLLGKRPRPSIKRTTSMTGITCAVDSPASDHDDQLVATEDGNNNNNIGTGNDNQTFYNYSDERFMASMVLSPRNNNTNNYQNNNKKAVETTANFLRTCGLCTHRLAPGRDIYMYRGDTAFCSLECREQQIKQDEGRDESRAIASKKDQDTTTNKSASCKIETTVTGFLGI